MKAGGSTPCTLGLTGERLSVWRDRLLSTQEMAQITAHLPHCSACQHTLAQFDDMARWLRNQPELEPGNRIWEQVHLRISQSSQERNVLMKSRTLWSGIGAAIAAFLIVVTFMQVLNHHPAGPGSSSTATPVPTTLTTPFRVTSIDMAVQPTTIAGMACGSPITVTYTATFHIAPQSQGGTIQFMYTWNNGRASTNASVTVAQGQTTATYSFAKSGQLLADHTFPGYGRVITNSPNTVDSPAIAPSGSCH